jgi:Fe-S cluster assembly protein SufD
VTAMARTATHHTVPAEAGRFAALLPSLPGAGGRLDELRRAGMAAFAAAGLPGQKVEDWKYTSLNPLRKLALDRFAAADAAAVDRVPALLDGSHRLVLVNGLHRPELSRLGGLPDGARVAALSDCLEDANVLEALGALAEVEASPLVALNAALFRDGYIVRLAANTRIEKPIEIVSLSLPGAEPTAAHVRNLIVAEAGARATIVEHHLAFGHGTYAMNGVSEVRLGRGADVRIYKVQNEGAGAFHLHRNEVELAEQAHLECFTLMLGAKLARNETNARLLGRGAAVHVNGAYVLRDGQHCDNLTAIDHAGVDTTSRQVFKGVLDGASQAVFQGRVLVRPGARGSDGQQLNKTLLLSPKAEIDSKPELEIHADDVKCSHGATVGELAREAMFYLRSRGIPEAEARHMLVEAFLTEAVDQVADATVAEAMRGLLTARLAGRDERAAA